MAGLEDITNPLNQAQGTIKAARGVLNEGVGLVKDVNKVAKEYRQYRENQADERAIAPTLTNSRATNRVLKRGKRQDIEEHNSEVQSSMEAARKVLLEKKRQEEEASLVWSMSKDERDAYYAQKQAQIEAVKAEKLRLIREEDARKARNEIITAVAFGMAATATVLWAFLLWLAYMTGSGFAWLPGVHLVR